MSTWTVYSFEEKKEDLVLFLDDMVRIFSLKNDDVDSYRDSMKEKIYYFDPKICPSLKSEIVGFLFYYRGEVAGLFYLDKSTPYYGTLFVHVFRDEAIDYIASYLYEHDYFDQAQLELSCIQDLDQFLPVFQRLDLTENKRDRMYKYLQHDQLFDIPSHHYTFRPMTVSDLDVTGSISYLAHQVSRDYYMYVEMNQLDKRVALEKKAFSELYGPVIGPASLIILDGDKIIGNCLVVEVATWGYNHVPWIFDINILPSYQGKGIGRLFFKHIINVLTDMEYQIMGLAVTADNFAQRLYTKLGFKVFDTFYEFTKEKE